jgi:hypothetical protein
MYDYTATGLAVSQLDMANAYLHLIDKKLKTISRDLRFITLIGVTFMLIKHKSKIKELIKMKGV